MDTVRQSEDRFFSTSLFYMWRCVIAIGHIDGALGLAERKHLEKVISNIDRFYGLSEEQKQTFIDDMDTAQDIGDLYRYINDPAVRGQLFYFGGLMARADGVYHPDEDAILKKLHADHMNGLDMDAIRSEVHEKVVDEIFAHDLEKAELREGSVLFSAIDAFMLAAGIDILE